MRRPTIALLGAAVFAGACGGAKVQAERPAAVPVTAAVAVRRDVPVEIKAIGTVEAYSTVSVRPQVGGIVTRVHFREGADVKVGDPLFTIDPRPYEAALRQAEATLARDQASARNAQVEARRAEDLFAQGILSKEAYDQSRSASDALEAAARADQAIVEKARLDLGFCSITSPIDGRTGSLLVHAGNLVKAIDGGPLVVINQTSPIYVSFAVPERRLAEVKRRMAAGRLAVEAVVPGDPGRPLKGELAFVDNAVDQGTGTIRLKARFANPERRLWPGQFVNVGLTLSTRTGAVVVPSPAVQAGQTGSFVFVVKPDLTVEARPVVLDGETDGSTVVDKGLEAGEQVVTDGQLRLVPGTRVEVKAGVRS